LFANETHHSMPDARGMLVNAQVNWKDRQATIHSFC